MIDLSDQAFMMIEPPAPASEPVMDEITELANKVWKALAQRSAVAYKGFHTCACGACSDNHDWTMPDGRKTNSLMVHYIQCHRDAIPRVELAKLVGYGLSLSVNTNIFTGEPLLPQPAPSFSNKACIECGEWSASGGSRCEDCEEDALGD